VGRVGGGGGVAVLLIDVSQLQLTWHSGWSARNFAAPILGQECNHTYTSS
jgi:hypothetical protein